MEEQFAEYVNYLTKVKSVSQNTIQSYVGDLKQLSCFLQEQKIYDFNNVTETNVNSFLLGLESQGLSPASINRKLVAIKGFVLFGIKRGFLHTDVTERIKPPKFEKKSPVSISVAQIEALLNAPDLSTKRGLRDKAMLELLYATGMKVSELVSLNVNDVVIKLMYVTVREKAGERLLPFGQAAKEALLAYLPVRQDAGSKTEPSVEETSDLEPLFYNRFHEPMTRQGFWKILKEYAKKTGISEDITPQVIRNSFAMHMIDNGADLYSLQELLGHGDISITQRYASKASGKTREVYQRTHPRGN